MNTDLMFSSKTDNWATPQYFFDALDAEFNFNLDVCASNTNHKCDLFYTQEMNGLAWPWLGRVWMNPPYGREIGQWVKKAREEVKAGRAELVACLVPARTDARWFQDNAWSADEIRFVRGRIAFGDSKTGAPFPCAVIIFRRDCDGPPIMTFYEVKKAA